MGWLNEFFGGKDKSTTNSSQTGRETTATETVLVGNEQQSSSQQTGAVSATNQTTAQEQVQQTLDADTQAQIKQIISVLSNQFATSGGSALSPKVQAGVNENIDFAKLFAERAAGADNANLGFIDSIINSARLQGERGLNQANTQITSAAGSGLNTAVAALKQRGSNDLETQLAALAGQLGLDARKTGTQEFAAAGQALGSAVAGGAQAELAGKSSSVADIASLSSILKGAEVSQIGTVAQTGLTESQETINQLTESLKKLQELGLSFTDKKTSGGSITKGGGDSLLDWLSSDFFNE